MTAASRLPFTVVTGFLGSGKTTLIRRLLACPQLARSAVIVNEFGDIGLDHELVEIADEDLVELSTGCLCCAVRGDLARAVSRLLERRGADGLDRIVLETTGLADPAPVLQSLLVERVLRENVTLERVVVTVDAVTGGATLDAHAVSRKQAALADVLLVTKTDLVPEHAALAARLRGLNGDAAIRPAVEGEVDPALVLGGVAREPAPIADRAAPSGHHPHDDITSVSLALDAPLPAVALTLFLQALAGACGADLLRVKGLVWVEESPDRAAVVHGVQHVFHPLGWRDGWPGGRRHTRLVLIGRRLRRSWVEALLAAVIEEVRAAAGR